MRSAFSALAATNFMRSPEGVMRLPASIWSRSQLASAVSPSLLPGATTSVTRFLPSVLIETDWIAGVRASTSAGMGCPAVAARLEKAKHAASNRMWTRECIMSFP
ncbi:hypothetical protein LJB71_06005 [Thermomonas sp. S9]|uniref:hypothetical protein n=1 Tax=Thermomonas sp. S9 TaxID=2885203 RepID=UPI0028700A69|nr:hypothetical protein [Thermomonas sp. S9]MCR6495825.1 hypothetical protein [Thermomonas sp. S9]